MTSMIAYCGLDCTQCEGYLATQADDDDARAKVAGEWSARYNADIRPETINCDGCRADGRKLFYCSDMCEIRKCASEKGVDTCAQCDDYACETLEAFFAMDPEGHARVALEALREG